MSYFSDYPLKKSVYGSMNIDNRKVLRIKALSSNKNSDINLSKFIEKIDKALEK